MKKRGECVVTHCLACLDQTKIFVVSLCFGRASLGKTAKYYSFTQWLLVDQSLCLHTDTTANIKRFVYEVIIPTTKSSFVISQNDWAECRLSADRGHVINGGNAYVRRWAAPVMAARDDARLVWNVLWQGLCFMSISSLKLYSIITRHNYNAYGWVTPIVIDGDESDKTSRDGRVTRRHSSEWLK